MSCLVWLHLSVALCPWNLRISLYQLLNFSMCANACRIFQLNWSSLQFSHCGATTLCLLTVALCLTSCQRQNVWFKTGERGGKGLTEPWGEVRSLQPDLWADRWGQRRKVLTSPCNTKISNSYVRLCLKYCFTCHLSPFFGNKSLFASCWGEAAGLLVMSFSKPFPGWNVISTTCSKGTIFCFCLPMSCRTFPSMPPPPFLWWLLGQGKQDLACVVCTFTEAASRAYLCPHWHWRCRSIHHCGRSYLAGSVSFNFNLRLSWRWPSIVKLKLNRLWLSL